MSSDNEPEIHQEALEEAGTEQEADKSELSYRGPPRDATRDATGFKYKSLNAYSLIPTLVPPFVLDEQLKKAKVRSSHRFDGDLEEQTDTHCKDPFLVSYNTQWAPFVENIGSNVAYLTHGIVPNGIKTQESSSMSSVSDNNEKMNKVEPHDSSSDTSDEGRLERDLVRKEVFTDLSGSWGGSERLNAVFNGPMLDNYDFHNPKDRSEWRAYLEQVKRFYYSNQDDPNSSGGITGEERDNDDEGKLHGFLERQRSEFKRKKIHWRQIERQKKQKWGPRLKRLLIDNQYLPLSFRMCIGILCVIALGLAIRIYQNSNSTVESIDSSIPQQPSTIMAICVNSIALFYLLYISYDEFSGKPLGLRNPFDKLRLILLDLLFIIFSSANLALTFNTLYDSKWVCTAGSFKSEEIPKVEYICRKQRALASFLFVVLFMWVITFTVSIVRVVEKVSSGTQR
ncbi:LAMI_0E11254g1_1 [Lachancea mirantina]|uniref:LAMI_0E11254g1_1 n=1 Tax=Lachancea mirantina TaxID=1230905 RepID=A0A1G4JPV4_9SACH|nr:LAMI_0E11254g1_1 [Lachancea mirantina]